MIPFLLPEEEVCVLLVMIELCEIGNKKLRKQMEESIGSYFFDIKKVIFEERMIWLTFLK